MAKAKSKNKNKTHILGDMLEVATSQEIEEARRKGLHKSISAIPKKKIYEISSGHMYRLIWMLGERIEKTIHDWYKEGGKMEDNGYDYGLGTIEEDLYILEDLLPYRLQNLKGEASGFDNPTNGDVDLFHRLGKIRKLVAFPPNVERFYASMEKYDVEDFAGSPICDICGKKGANSYSNRFITHLDCLAKHGWYQCSSCLWAYPVDVGQCKRKYSCAKGKIEKCEAGPIPEL